MTLEKISQEEMEKLHKDGKIKLKDGSMLFFVKEEDMDEAMSNPDQRHKDDKGPDRGAERKSLDSEPRYNKKDTE